MADLARLLCLNIWGGLRNIEFAGSTVKEASIGTDDDFVVFQSEGGKPDRNRHQTPFEWALSSGMGCLGHTCAWFHGFVSKMQDQPSLVPNIKTTAKSALSEQGSFKIVAGPGDSQALERIFELVLDCNNVPAQVRQNHRITMYGGRHFNLDRTCFAQQGLMPARATSAVD